MRIAYMAEIAKCAVFAAIFMALLLPAAANEDRCAMMAAMDPSSVKTSIRILGGPVLGKYPDLWTDSDFENLVANAEICNGRPQGRIHRISAISWRHQMKEAAAMTAVARSTSMAVRTAYAPEWTWGEVPSCISLLGWVRDPVWYGENSLEIFGIDLTGAGASKRFLVTGFATECLPVMEESLRRQRKDAKIAKRIVDDITASSIRAAAAENDLTESLPESLKAFHDGKVIPVAHLGDGGRQAVGIAAEAHLQERRLTAEEMVSITKWADSVSRNNGPAAAYAEILKAYISRNIFGN